MRVTPFRSREGKVIPSIKFAGIYIYTDLGGERHCERMVSHRGRDREGHGNLY